MNEYGKQVKKQMDTYIDNPDSIDKEISDIQNATHGVEVRGALAAGVKKSFDKSVEARDITENLLDGSYDQGLLNTEIENRMDNLYNTKGQAMDELHDAKETELDNLKQEYADKATTLETTYAPRLTSIETEIEDARGGETNLGDRLNEFSSQLAQIPQQINDAVEPKADKSKLVETNTNLAQAINQIDAEVSGTNQRIDNLIIPISPENSNVEVTNALTSVAKGKSFSTLSNRFEEIEKGLVNYFKGLNAENTVTNGNFTDDSFWRYNTDLVYSVANNELVITEVNAAGAEVFGTLPSVEGHIYYISEEMKSNRANTDQLFISDPATSIYHSGSGEYEKLSAVFTAKNQIPVRLLNSTSTGDLTENPIRIRRVMLVDLTKMYGAGNEPTKEEFEKLLEFAFPYTNGWFDGVMQPIMDYERSFKYLYEKFKNEDDPVNPAATNWIALGDSITARVTGYAYQANQRLNFNLTNAGVGGSSMAVRGGNFASYDDDSFVRKVQTINFSQYEVVTILFGTNDWSSSVPIGTTNGGETTFKGALNLGLQKIIESNQGIKILIITPPYRHHAQYNKNDLDLKVIDYVDAIKEVAEEFCLNTLDLYRTSGINYFSLGAFMSDGLHPNDEGAKLIGNRVAGELYYM